MSKVTVLCVGILYFAVFETACKKHCAQFKFPTPSKTIDAQEHKELVLLFELDIEDCSLGAENFSIIISKSEPTKYQLVCYILHTKGSCQDATSGCRCLPQSGNYSFTKIVDRNDSTQWMWRTTNGIAERVYRALDVHYPTQITELTFVSGDVASAEDPVPEYSHVSIVCSFVNGNPQTDVRLLDRYGNEFLATVDRTKRVIRHELPSVTCDDAGLIRCEAPGASHNKTATLLVKCPPNLSDTEIKMLDGSEGAGDLSIEFGLRAYTNEFSECCLTKLQSDGNVPLKGGSISLPCLGPVISGTPPDLRLTIQLADLKREDGGKWRILLTNTGGRGHVDFWIRVPDKNDTNEIKILPDSTTKGVNTEDTPASGSNTDNTVIIAGASASVFVVMIVVVVIVVCKRRGRRGRDEEDEDTPAYADPAAEAMGLRELDIRRRAEPSVEMHDYCDIPELNRASGAQAPYPENEYLEPGPLHLPPPPESHRPDSNPGGYEATSSYAMLNPVYETMRSAYADLRRLSQRLSRRLSRLPPPMFDDDD